MKLFLCGDVMTGRGIDQIQAHPAHSRIHERYARSALDYVGLAEAVNGPIPRTVESWLIQINMESCGGRHNALRRNVLF